MRDYGEDVLPASVVLKPLWCALALWAVLVPLLVGVFGHDARGSVRWPDGEGLTCWLNVDYLAAPTRNGEVMFVLPKGACARHKSNELFGVRALSAFGLDLAIPRSSSRGPALDALLAAARRVSPLALVFLIWLISRLSSIKAKLDAAAPAARAAASYAPTIFIPLAFAAALYFAAAPSIMLRARGQYADGVLDYAPSVTEKGQCMVSFNYQAKPGLAPRETVFLRRSACDALKGVKTIRVHYAVLGEHTWERPILPGIGEVSGSNEAHGSDFVSRIEGQFGFALLFFAVITLQGWLSRKKKAPGSM